MTSVFGRGLRCTPTENFKIYGSPIVCHSNLKNAVFQTISINRNDDITCR